MQHRHLMTLYVLILLFTGGPTRLRAQPAAHSLLIAGGTVIDGSGRKGRLADVRIAGDTIRAVGHLQPIAGEKVLNASGLTITPGFIDTHSHADGGLLEMPDAETQIRQGITTSVVGQDGSSHYPLAGWFGQLEQHPVALNIASFVGHGTIRQQVTGEDYKRAVTPAELEKMRALVDQEMKSGGLGLSSGLEYDPGFYSTTAELVGLAEVAGKDGGMYISHVRDEGNDFFKALDEVITIARDGHLPAQVSHIKLDTAPVWNRAGDVLKRMADARSEGLDITADVYPYLYWQSTMTVLIPSRDWDNRALWEQGLKDVGGPSHILLTSYSGTPAWQGKNIAEIAAMTGRDPISVIQEIVHTVHDPGKTGSESVVVSAMTALDLRAFLADPHIMFCTDGGLKGSHPRGAGSYPRILSEYVREQGVLRLEEAIRKATSLPAHRMGFKDRGLIRAGMKADLVLFNPATVHDTATTAQPTAQPSGIPYVFVNGVAVLENGTITGQHPGLVLRRKASINHPLRP